MLVLIHNALLSLQSIYPSQFSSKNVRFGAVVPSAGLTLKIFAFLGGACADGSSS